VTEPLTEPLTVVGIGADGWAGLAGPARSALVAARVVLGGPRHLGMLPADVGGERVCWPSPMVAALPELLGRYADRVVCVVASGDPMLHGVGSTLVGLLGPDRVRVLPHPSSVSLACARMGWATDGVDVVALVGRPVQTLHPAVQPGRRIVVLSTDADSPAEVARLLDTRGYGRSTLTVLEQLGGPAERIVTGVAGDWQVRPGDPLNVVAIECRPADPSGVSLPVALLATVPGLPDEAYAHDGQLTKREIRAVTLARLVPVPGQLLWDVGAGAGSIAIEWMRTHRSCRAVAIERDADRAARIGRNADALGVPGLAVRTGTAPPALADLPAPDAVFIGGGLTAPGLVDACWAALVGGGRLVVNAVTVESEQVVARWYARLGGDLTRLAVSRAAPVGGFTGWKPMAPVTQWSVTKP
jgi:precorrin-6Y C5,15-methyltransferase (decarboxylating)